MSESWSELSREDFESTVLDALSDLRRDVTQVKKDLGRALVAAYQTGAKAKDEHSGPPVPRKKRFRVIKGGLAAAPVAALQKVADHPTSAVAVVAIIGFGALFLFRPAPEVKERVVAGPTTTVSAGAPPTHTGSPTMTERPTGRPSGATEPSGGGSAEPTPADSYSAGSYGGRDEPTSRGGSGARPPVEERRSRPEPTTHRPTQEPTTRPPATHPPTAPPGHRSCVLRARALGLDVQLLCS